MDRGPWLGTPFHSTKFAKKDRSAVPRSRRPPARARLGLLGATLALAGGAVLAALPAAGAAAGGAPDAIVMAQLAGDRSDAAAGDVAGRAGLELESNLPEIGWAVYGIDGDVAAARTRLLRDRSEEHTSELQSLRQL